MVYNFEELSFKSVSVFRFKHKDGHFVVKPRPYAALAFRLSGQGEFKFNNNSFTASEKSVCFIPANVGYELNSYKSEIIVIHLFDCNYFEPETYSFTNYASFEALFLKALEYYSKTGAINRVKAIVYEIFDRLESENKMLYQNSTFQKCLNYIESNYADVNLDVSEVANVAFISKSSLQRAFNNYLGISPKAYLIKLRIGKAVEMLMESDKSVKEVAFLCGFSDEKFFSRTFSKKYGYPPSAIKKR